MTTFSWKAKPFGCSHTRRRDRGAGAKNSDLGHEEIRLRSSSGEAAKAGRKLQAGAPS